MNAEQYKRANKNSYYVTIVILLSGLAMTVFNIVQEGMSAGKNALIISAIVGALMASLGNFKFQGVKRGSILIMGGATIFYVVLLLSVDELVYFAFGLPILICSIIYLNVKLCTYGIGAISVSFIITVISPVQHLRVFGMMTIFGVIIIMSVTAGIVPTY